MPANGGKECEGDGEEYGPCENLTPCPINCGLSQWGAWSPCSITCGDVGQGIKERHRHIATQAQYGGQPCPADPLKQTDVCPHSSGDKPLTDAEMKIAIPYCPIDCEYGPWGPFTPCEAVGIYRNKMIYSITLELILLYSMYL